MGDYTWTNTTIAASDLMRVAALILHRRWFHVDHSTGIAEGTVTIEQAEVNNGGDYDADVLEKAGIPFVIHHGSGCSYPEGCTVFDGTQRVWIAMVEGSPVIRFSEETKSPDAGEADHARVFCAMRAATRAAMKERSERQGTAGLPPVFDNQR